MHRVFNIKHRIVRREAVLRAPLATFDTIDLGDEDVRSNHTQSTATSSLGLCDQLLNIRPSKVLLEDGTLKTKTIGANNSKKGLSQAGGEDKGGKDADAVKEKNCPLGGNVDNTNENNIAVSGSALVEPADLHLPESLTPKSESPSGSKRREDEKPSFSSGLNRQGTIGRVSIPIKKQDSDSSSSSGSCNETTFKFHASRPSVGHLEVTDAEGNFVTDRDTPTNLCPEIIDPSQILSPSKRKAYERRIERLRVTTSPIARPRSQTPISVVTLDEYANISSPELSPAPPSLIPDKLKITLPCDEFNLKPKTPKLLSAKRKDSDEVCFEFTEEILFSRTKSALVVNEDGQIPVSPRRVLIPPTLTPSTSPKLSSGPRFPGCSAGDESPSAPKLLYIQQNEAAHSIFGETVSGPEEENWASFPDSISLSDTKESDGIDECEKLQCDIIPSITPACCDENSVNAESVCAKCSKTLSRHDSSVCKFVQSTGLEQGVPVGHIKVTLDECAQNKYSEDLSAGFKDACPYVSSVKLEATPLIKKLTDLESDEVLTVAIDEPEQGFAKLVAIEIKTADRLSAGIQKEGKPIHYALEKSDVLLIITENVVDEDVRLNHTQSTVINQEAAVFLPSDVKPFELREETTSENDSSKDSLLNFDPNASGDSTSLLIKGQIAETDVRLPGDQICQNSFVPLVPNVSITQALGDNCVVPSVSITQALGDNCVVPSVSITQALGDNCEPVSTITVLLSGQEDIFQQDQPQTDQIESPSGADIFQCPQTVLPERPPSTNPFDDFQPFIPERPPSTNPFEEFQTILPVRPPSTNPFEEFQTNFPDRPPSTNPFEEFQTSLPVQSPISNPFDVFSTVVPELASSTNPFNVSYEPQLFNTENLTHPPPEVLGQSADLVDLLSSS